MDSIGKRLKNLRITAGLGQDSLADQLGISSGHISKIEHDKTNITADIIIAYMQNFNVSADYILVGNLQCTKLSDEDSHFLEQFHGLPTELKAKVISFLEICSLQL